MEEIWKDIKGYEGLYKVSNYGRIWSVKRVNRGRIFGDKTISISVDKRGRRYVILSNKGEKTSFVVSRLVAFAFVENPKPEIYKEVNHLDENTLNDRYDNLEWCEHKYNCNYGTRMERIKSKQSIPILQYTLNGDFIAEHKSMHEAAKSINANAGHICDCCLGNRKWAYGFFWRYKDDSLYENAKQALDRKIKLSKESRKEKIAIKCGKPVEQYSKDGIFIARYPSTRHASESTGICRVSIINASNGKLNHAGGYIWKNA